MKTKTVRVFIVLVLLLSKQLYASTAADSCYSLAKGRQSLRASFNFGFLGNAQITLARSYMLNPSFEYFFRNKLSVNAGLGFYHSNVIGFKDSAGNRLGGLLRHYMAHADIRKHIATRKQVWSFNFFVGFCAGWETWRSHRDPSFYPKVFSYNPYFGLGLRINPKRLFGVDQPRIAFHMDIPFYLRIGQRTTFLPGSLGLTFRLK